MRKPVVFTRIPGNQPDPKVVADFLYRHFQRQNRATQVAVKPEPPRIAARKRKGQCFRLAGKGALEDPSWTLVHGRVAFLSKAPRLLCAHAWLEKDGYVYDPVDDVTMPKEHYVRKFHAVVERRYKRVRQLVLRHESWGPWHDMPDILVRVGGKVS